MLMCPYHPAYLTRTIRKTLQGPSERPGTYQVVDSKTKTWHHGTSLKNHYFFVACINVHAVNVPANCTFVITCTATNTCLWLSVLDGDIVNTRVILLSFINGVWMRNFNWDYQKLIGKYAYNVVQLNTVKHISLLIEAQWNNYVRWMRRS